MLSFHPIQVYQIPLFKFLRKVNLFYSIKGYLKYIVAAFVELNNERIQDKK